MRVLFLNPAGCIGGAERVLLGIGRALQADGTVAVRLLTTSDGPLVDDARRLGIGVDVVPIPPALARLGEQSFAGRAAWAAGFRAPLAAPYLLRLRRAIAAWRPDVLHTNGLKAHLLGALTRPGGARLVWHLHDYVSSRPFTGRLLRGCARRCDTAFAVSEDVAADARAFLPRVPLVTIENGVDLARFAVAGPRTRLDPDAALTPPGTIRVGLVATYARWKGHDVFLRALARLRHLPIRAYIIGGPIYETDSSQWTRAELRALAAATGVADRVRFLDFAHDVAPVMRALDVVVHASTSREPFGLVIAEAMSTGRAVIASRAGGAAALVTDGADGLLHDPADDAGLAVAIARLAADAADRHRLGAAARATAERRFDDARAAAAVLASYRHLLRNTHRQASTAGAVA